MSAEAAREASFRRKKFKDKYQKTNQFEAVALTDGYKLTQKETAAITPSAGASTSGSPPNRFARQAFRGRIIGEYSPHWFIPDPCDLASTIGPHYTSVLILQHTEFLLTEDYYDSSGQTTINRNDRVNVYLEPGPAGAPFNLERGWCIGVNRSSKTSARARDRAIDCTTLQEIFDSSTGATSMGGAGTGATTVNCQGVPHRSADAIRDAFSSRGLTLAQAESIVASAERISSCMDPGWLANVINMESGFDPQNVNRHEGTHPDTGETMPPTLATGLIQWLPRYAASEFKKAGVPEFQEYTGHQTGDTQRLEYYWNAESQTAAQEKMENLDFDQQMEYVEQWFNKYSDTDLCNQADVMMGVFYPVAMGEPGSYQFPANVVGSNSNIATKADYVNKALGNASTYWNPPC